MCGDYASSEHVLSAEHACLTEARQWENRESLEDLRSIPYRVCRMLCDRLYPRDWRVLYSLERGTQLLLLL